MATTLQLIQGSTTVDLYNGTTTKTLKDWGFGSGGYMDLDTTTETVEVQIKQTTNALLLSTRSSIVAILQSARERQDDPSIEPVYVKFQPEGAASAWRSEILDYQQVDPGDVYGEQWLRHDATISITWMRRNYWEANVETQIQLNNPNGTDTLDAITIFASNDGTNSGAGLRYAYVSMNADQITGDLRAPCRVELTAAGGATGFYAVVMGTNWHDPGYMPYQLEAEAQDGTTDVADTACSGGYKVSYTIDNGAVSGPRGEIPFTEVEIFTLSAAQTAAALGGRFHAVVRFQSGDITDIYWWVQVDGVDLGKIKPSTGSLYNVGGGTYIVDLGAFILPSNLARQTGTKASSIILKALQTSGTSETVTIDCLYLFPADYWVRCNTNSGSAVMQFNGIDDLYYGSAADGTAKNGYQWYGEKIMLVPNKKQRIFFWFQTSSSEAVTDKATVKVYYRPRRLHV